jgi:hypothetical protein
MHGLLLLFSRLASTAVGALPAKELQIDVMLPVECERKTQKGDKVNIHYRETFAIQCYKFNASRWNSFAICWWIVVVCCLRCSPRPADVFSSEDRAFANLLP